MKSLLATYKTIAPDFFKVIEKRYEILKKIEIYQPIGRRGISNLTNISERIIRSDIEVLRKEELIYISSKGMELTTKGKEIIKELENNIYGIKGFKDLSTKLEKALGVRKIYIVQGNSDLDNSILYNIGKKASEVLIENIKENGIIAVTGGSSLLELSKAISSTRKFKDALILPARGGLGAELDLQANNISANIAKKLGAQYRLFQVPDNLDSEVKKSLMKVDDIKQTIRYMKEANMLVFGVGKADKMAETRNLKEETIKEIKNKKGVAEVFGYFFDIDGNLIYEISTLGMELDDFKKTENLIGIAGGEEKAEAIISITKLNSNMTLVVDEIMAKKIEEILRL